MIKYFNSRIFAALVMLACSPVVSILSPFVAIMCFILESLFFDPSMNRTHIKVYFWDAFSYPVSCFDDLMFEIADA